MLEQETRFSVNSALYSVSCSDICGQFESVICMYGTATCMYCYPVRNATIVGFIRHRSLGAVDTNNRTCISAVLRNRVVTERPISRFMETDHKVVGWECYAQYLEFDVLFLLNNRSPQNHSHISRCYLLEK